MSAPYETRIAIHWLTNLITRMDPRSEEAGRLARWLFENADRKIKGESGKWRPLETAARATGFRRKHSEPWSRWKPSSGEWKRLKAALGDLRGQTERVRPDRTARRLRLLAKATGMNCEDVEILEALLRYRTDPWLESLVDDLELSDRRRHPFHVQGTGLSRLLGLGRGRIQQRLTRTSPLLRSGCLSVDEDGDVVLSRRLERLATAPDKGGDVRRLLLGTCSPTELEWSDFGHLAEVRDDAAAILSGARAKSDRGVNILLHGPPGCGKTSLAKVLAAHLGTTLVPAGEADESGDEPTRGERLSDLRFAQSLLGRDSRGIVFVDEAEDVLGGASDVSPMRIMGLSAGPDRGSRVFLHRLLEENPAPTIWATNRADGLDEAVLRRMTFAVEMRKPPTRVRERIWTRQLEKYGIRATEEDIRKLNRDFDVSPGLAEGAVRGAVHCGGDAPAVRRTTSGLTRLVSGPAPPREEHRDFDPGLSQGDIDLKALADDICSTGDLRFSVCLTGPPGAGKSAWVRYLAERLDLEVRHKRTSDLLGKYVGESEKRIAAAFQQAADDKVFLVFDEADSLLQDRQGAVRSWEISQVNEMLTWMESHPLPFACTTNLAETLDAASLRRFTFKVKLGYLTPEQAEQAFRFFFDLEPPAGLSGIRILTPGDFAVVRRKAEIRGRLDDARALVGMLQRECDAKPDRTATVGFRDREPSRRDD